MNRMKADEPWRIGDVMVPGKLILAPMAGVTDLPFRLLCKEKGADLIYTEMVSAKGIYYNSKNTEALLEVKEEERPVALQLFGSDPQIISSMAAKIEDRNFDILDINMGCPVPKVVNNGEGSALLKNIPLAEQIIRETVKAVNKPVTVKFRKGFLDGEEVPVRDLFYGTILPSGGDAAVGLATYISGSQESFVELMNDKLEELGLSDSAHFTNCIGLYDADHYCTAYDMAVIMKAAMENEMCREFLSAHTYTTAPTTQHPDGITISNWFLRKIEDKDMGGEVLCGKTGYVVQSRNCAVSYSRIQGTPYICVTIGATSNWRCIYDHVEIYNRYVSSAAKGQSSDASG